MRPMKNQIKFLSLDDMWGIKGRVGRLHYALVTVRLVVLSFLLFSLLPTVSNLLSHLGVTLEIAQSVLVLIIALMLLLCWVSILIRRVQDIGYPYWSVYIVILLGFLLPWDIQIVKNITTCIGFILQMVLLFMPGESGENKYGLAVEERDSQEYKWMKSTTQGIAVLGVIFIVAGAFVISFQKYIPQDYLPEEFQIPQGISIQP